MFVVMNRFQINPDRTEDFEQSWRTRESELKSFRGFQSFALLRADAGEGPREYISHTVWRSRADFDEWRNSESFQRAHSGAQVTGVIQGPPHATLYEAVLEEYAEATV